MKFALYEQVVNMTGTVMNDADVRMDKNTLQYETGEIRGVRGGTNLEYLVQFNYKLCAYPVWILESNLKRKGT